MIWVFIIALCFVVFVYICLPLFRQTGLSANNSAAHKNEIDSYRKALIELERNYSGDISNQVIKTTLGRQLLKKTDEFPEANDGKKTSWMVGIFCVLMSGTVGTYALIGSPNLSTTEAFQPAVLSPSQALSQNKNTPQHENDASMDQLIAGLEQKLKAGSVNPQQWGLYARSLMTVNRFEEAFKAYERTISLTDNNPEIIAELASARIFAAQESGEVAMKQAGPTQSDIDAAQSMAPADQAAMIQGMVDGLSEKLLDDPKNPDGWVRLLKARQVLGQKEAAQTEIERLKKAYADEPNTVETILRRSGYGK